MKPRAGCRKHCEWVKSLWDPLTCDVLCPPSPSPFFVPLPWVKGSGFNRQLLHRGLHLKESREGQTKGNSAVVTEQAFLGNRAFFKSYSLWNMSPWSPGQRTGAPQLPHYGNRLTSSTQVPSCESGLVLARHSRLFFPGRHRQPCWYAFPPWLTELQWGGPGKVLPVVPEIQRVL